MCVAPSPTPKCLENAENWGWGGGTALMSVHAKVSVSLYKATSVMILQSFER